MLKFLNKHDYRTQIYNEKKTMVQWVKKLWCHGKKLWYFDLLWKNYGTIPKTIVLQETVVKLTIVNYTLI